ncbi:MAG: response regulator transcription factor [Actinomycetota bacterium]|nr:response regulator transcription factor [Actinomycetota bacterium]
MKRVLVVDDEADIRGLVRELLQRAGHDVIEAPDGDAGLKLFYKEHPDLVILDVSMPGLDGWNMLARIRELSDVPVLMLTARAEELDKVRGLRGGADDYITKPFGRQELLARVNANLRRSRSEPSAPETYADEFVTINFAQRAVRAGDRDLSLTPLEFRLLGAFVRNPKQVLSHEQLLELVWGDERAAERDQVKLYVGYLRRKLGTAENGESPIETVRGFGYRYRPLQAG